MAHLTARALNQQPRQKEWGRGGSLFGPESWKHRRRYSNLTFLSSAVTPSCLQGSFSLPPCQPPPPLPHLPRNHGGMFMIQAGDGDPGYPALCLRHLPPFPATFCLCARLKLAKPLTSPPAPADSLLPPRSGLAQPGLPVCCTAQRATRSSALSTGDRLFGIYPRRCACLFICSLFQGSKKQFLLPLIFPLTPFSSTHSTNLPPLPPLPPYLLLIPSC